jgi:hypothetical protein
VANQRMFARTAAGLLSGIPHQSAFVPRLHRADLVPSRETAQVNKKAGSLSGGRRCFVPVRFFQHRSTAPALSVCSARDIVVGAKRRSQSFRWSHVALPGPRRSENRCSSAEGRTAPQTAGPSSGSTNERATSPQGNSAVDPGHRTDHDALTVPDPPPEGEASEAELARSPMCVGLPRALIMTARKAFGASSWSVRKNALI